MTPMPDAGLVTLSCPYTVSAAAHRLESLLQTLGIKLFARIDHSGEAANVGLKMPPTQVILFGNPKAGTHLMIAAPTVAIDLPLKALIWEDAEGKVWVSYNSSEFLQSRHNFLASCCRILQALQRFLKK